MELLFGCTTVIGNGRGHISDRSGTSQNTHVLLFLLAGLAPESHGITQYRVLPQRHTAYCRLLLIKIYCPHGHFKKKEDEMIIINQRHSGATFLSLSWTVSAELLYLPDEKVTRGLIH